jgi:hypothetical protein
MARTKMKERQLGICSEAITVLAVEFPPGTCLTNLCGPIPLFFSLDWRKKPSVLIRFS